MIPGVFAGAMGQSGGGGGAGPVVLGITTGETAGSSIAMPMPDTTPGDLLIAVMGNTRPRGFAGAPTGWTDLLSETSARPSQAIRYRIADGSEGSTTVNFGFSGTATGIMLLIHIQAGTFNGAAPIEAIGGAVSVSTNTAPDAPSLSPSWGYATSRWFAVSVISRNDLGQSVTVWPYADNHIEVLYSGGTTGAAIPQLILCSETIEASSQNPSAFTVTAPTAWLAQTFAVQG